MGRQQKMKRLQKRQEAETRRAAHDALTIAQKLDKIVARRDSPIGRERSWHSTRELARLQRAGR